MKRITQFHFKKFAVWHHRSAMKVGVDGVLIGCWTETSGAKRILDVGTGCGLIALIMAQRQPDAFITGIEVDIPSADEAAQNIQDSPWSDRMCIIQGEFPAYFYTDIDKDSDLKFDLIVSNPPYFDSGVTEIRTSRERARHQGQLSPSSLLMDAVTLLNNGGMLAMIVPSEFSELLECDAHSLGYSLMRKCMVRGHEEAPYKRVLLQWKLGGTAEQQEIIEPEYLTLEISQGVPTNEYRELCKDFYLKF